MGKESEFLTAANMSIVVPFTGMGGKRQKKQVSGLGPCVGRNASSVSRHTESEAATGHPHRDECPA